MNERRYGLLERLAEEPVICAEGYLFELERRGYLQAGAFVPEVVLDPGCVYSLYLRVWPLRFLGASVGQLHGKGEWLVGCSSPVS